MALPPADPSDTYAALVHASSALSPVLDLAAALSCEASRADVAAALDHYHSSEVKDERDVARDLRSLLGPNFSGLHHVPPCSDAPAVHAALREAVRALSSRRSPGPAVPYLSAATGSARDLSLGRLRAAIGSVANPELRSALAGAVGSIFGSGSVDLVENFVGISLRGDGVVSAAWEVVVVELRKAMAWEVAVALWLLEGKEEKKEKKKKKKAAAAAVWRKGTDVLRGGIKEKLSGENAGSAADGLKAWAGELFELLDPRGKELASLAEKVNEVVQSNEVRRLPKIPKGTRDFGKDQMAIRERAFAKIIRVFKRHGAVGLDTPDFELRETLMGKYGEDSKLIYDLADQGGEICSLRYDLTVPFARYLATNGIEKMKRYQIGKVHRRDNPSKGRYREFYQCDFDIAGDYGVPMGPDFEVIRIFVELLKELDVGDFEIKVNHRKLLDGILELCGVPSEKFRTVCSSIDKLDKQTFDQVKKELVEEKGLEVEVVDKIGTFVSKQGHPKNVLSDLKRDGSPFLVNEGCVAALKDLGCLFDALEKARAVDKISFDLSLARGLDYYTGVIFEAVTKGSAQVGIGSIGAGGRYDNLVGMFSGKPVPCVGVSLGIERVFAIMEALSQSGKQEKIRPTETQVLVAVLGSPEKDLGIAAQLAAQLWDMNIPSEFGVHKKIGKHLDRALVNEIPFMVIVGELERQRGVVMLKDMKAEKEEEVEEGEVVQVLNGKLMRTGETDGEA